MSVFPQGLDGTLLVPVVTGVFVMFLLTEWWGWDFVGLVVPGYLCSLLLLQPTVAAVVLLESIATWALVEALTWVTTTSGWVHPTFGRDRFYLFIALSVPVRLIAEGFALQVVWASVEARWPSLSPMRSELFAIGTVLVPLTANRFYRPGLARGLFQLTVHTLVVLLFLLFLQKHTNFSIAAFDLAYDQLALSFFASPRIQVAILITAAVASGFNRRYGWDSHGILVPALLALLITGPIKAAATIVESISIWLLARALVQLPIFRNVNIEGGRKLIICLCVGVGVRVLVATGLESRFPGFRPSDFFGFGYLLPSLLAERMWTRANASLILLPSIQTALMGGAATVVLMAAMAWAAPAPPLTPPMLPVFDSLAQAVAVAGGQTKGLSPAEPGALAAAPVTATTRDGYSIRALPDRTGLFAGHASAHGTAQTTRSWRAAEDAAPAAAAAHGNLLVLPLEQGPGLQSATTRSSDESVRDRIDAPPAPGETPASPAAMAEAARRLRDFSGQPGLLAASLRPLGASLTRAADGVWMLDTTGWPVVALASRQNAPVVVAPRWRELHSGDVAWLAARALDATLVVGHPGQEEDAELLAAGLAPEGVPLLVVRGTSSPLPADAAWISSPDEAGAPPWIAPAVELLRMRLSVAPASNTLAPNLRTFPPGRHTPTVVLWTSAVARRELASRGWWSDESFDNFAKTFGIAQAQEDLAAWVMGGSGHVSAAELDRAIAFARSRDVALLRPSGTVRWTLATDLSSGLSAVAVEQDGARALAFTGEREETQSSVTTAGDARIALLRGARTVLKR